MMRQQRPLTGLAVRFLAILCVSLIASNLASASTVSITISVANLVFDGTDIVDAGSPAHGSGDLAEADSIDSMVFQVDGSTVGTLVAPPGDLGVDIYIPSVSAIPDTGGVGLSAAGGTFDLLTSALVPGYGLELTLGEAEVIYAPIAGAVHFAFVGSVAAVGSQDLPFDLEIGDPINVTLSTQASSITSAGGFITSFVSAGSGEVTGELDLGEQDIPEPSTAALGLIGMAIVGWRRKR